VLWGWWNNFWLGRDLVNLSTVQSPRYVFEEFAARPRPVQPAVTPPAEPRGAGKQADQPEKVEADKVSASR
jgi:NADH dehydrogenase